MMKHPFIKKALILSTMTLVLNSVPLAAMDRPANPQIEQRISAETVNFQDMPKEALEKELDPTMKKLSRQWKSMMSCLSSKLPRRLTGEEPGINSQGCTKGQVALVVATLITLLAIVRILAAKFGPQQLGWTGAEKSVGGWMGRQATGAYQGTKSFLGQQGAAMRSRIGRYVPGTPST